MKTKKSKFLKAFGFSSLALLMGIAGTMAFAPLGATPSVAGASTVDQINTKADGENIKYAPSALGLDPENDPVIYTTESGLELKSHYISNATPVSKVQYFTLGSYNGTPVNWLIVGITDSGFYDNTPAGNAVVGDLAKQQVATGALSSNLTHNQILCISEYAFNQSSYTPNFVAKPVYTYTCTSWGTWNYPQTTNEWTDYVSSYTEPSVAASSLSLGTTLGINSYYGSGSGKIVKNSNFSSNYVFSLSSTDYTTFVIPTQHKVPYLFTATTTTANIWLGNTTMSGAVSSTFSAVETSNYDYQVNTSSRGNATAFLVNFASTSGEIVTTANPTLGTFTAVPTRLSSYFRDSDGDYSYNYNSTYSVTSNSSISMAYRPAFVMQI